MTLLYLQQALVQLGLQEGARTGEPHFFTSFLFLFKWGEMQRLDFDPLQGLGVGWCNKYSSAVSFPGLLALSA